MERLPEPFFIWCCVVVLVLKGCVMSDKEKTNTKEKDVIAYRKSCKAEGTGLSHYVLMDKKAK